MVYSNINYYYKSLFLNYYKKYMKNFHLNKYYIFIKRFFLYLSYFDYIHYHKYLLFHKNIFESHSLEHVIFYILGIIFLLFFWMLLSSFGAVYQNSQIILFECVLISFGISFVYPFVYNFIPCIFIFKICFVNSRI